MDGEPASVEASRARAVPDGRGVMPVQEGWAAWRVATAQERPVLPDRESVIQRIAHLAIRASLPEPGLPLRFKNRLEPAGAIEDVLSLVRRRVRAVPAFDRGPLSPRPLVAVLRSGWGTAWEQALLLTRYLRQLKIDATPMPVRPRSLGVGDPAGPEGYRAAVVRVNEAARTRWIVPACALCALDEIPADLHEAPVLSADMTQLPPSTPGSVYVVSLPDGGSRVTLEGAAARSLREQLLSMRPAARLGAVATLVGAEGATLRSHQGLSEPGETVVLELDGPARGPSLPDVAFQGSAEVVLPFAGVWSWSPSPPGLEPVSTKDGSMAWEMDGDVATLTVSQPVVERREAALVLARARRALAARDRSGPPGSAGGGFPQEGSGLQEVDDL